MLASSFCIEIVLQCTLYNIWKIKMTINLTCSISSTGFLSQSNAGLYPLEVAREVQGPLVQGWHGDNHLREDEQGQRDL